MRLADRARFIRSIRGNILLAFLAMSALTVALGGYGLLTVSHSGRLVAETYDKPLMAINFARSAMYAFGLMDKHLGLQRSARTPFAVDHHHARIEKADQTLWEDLAVAEERSLSPRASAVIRDISRLVLRWDQLRVAAMHYGPYAAEWSEIDAITGDVLAKFELLTELAAADGFFMRQDALRSIDNWRTANAAAIAAALALSLAITLVLARRILRPLSAASTVAERIARGELDVPIPPPGQDETGALLRAMATMQDSLREMMAREVEQRRSAQSRLTDAVENSSEAVILLDPERRIAVVNSQARRFLPGVAELLRPGEGYDAVMATAAARGLFSAQDAASDHAHRWLAVHGTAPAVGEERLADGRWLRASRAPTRDGGVVIIWSDVTEMKAREDSLRAAKEQAEAASATKTRFLTQMSHELRTPLNAVIGFSEVIASEMLGPLGAPRYREYANDILKSGQHLLEVINDILDIAKSDEGKLHVRLSDVDVSEVVANCRTIMEEQCRRAGLTLQMRLPAAPGYIEADAAKLRQILLNLLSNAMKFTRPGGEIELRVSELAEEGLAFTVEDTGIGMSAEELPIALAPFGQIDSSLARKYEGTGLGLPLTKALVELHGGALSIASEPGRGTAVTVSIPGRRRPGRAAPRLVAVS